MIANEKEDLYISENKVEKPMKVLFFYFQLSEAIRDFYFKSNNWTD